MIAHPPPYPFLWGWIFLSSIPKLQSHKPANRPHSVRTWGNFRCDAKTQSAQGSLQRYSIIPLLSLHGYPSPPEGKRGFSHLLASYEGYPVKSGDSSYKKWLQLGRKKKITHSGGDVSADSPEELTNMLMRSQYLHARGIEGASRQVVLVEKQ